MRGSLPCESFTLSPPPSPRRGSQGSVNLLSQQFSAHTLSQYSSTSTATDLPTPPPEFDISPQAGIIFRNPSFSTTAFSDTSSDPTSSPESAPRSLPPQLPYSNYHLHNIRRSRQDAIRRQCSDSHLREISQLVARMVESGDQCAVCSTHSRVASAVEDSAQEDDNIDTGSTYDADEERPGISDSNEVLRPSLGRAVTTQSASSSKGCVTKRRQRPGVRRKAAARR